MKTSEFIHEMTETSKILGRDSGVRVIFKGEQAGTNEDTIILPALPLNKALTNDQVRVMRGYVDHEAGHRRHSDMPRIMDFYKRCLNNGKEELKHLHNCLEDVWMEDRVVFDYQGSHKNLKAVNEKIFEDLKEEIAEEETKERMSAPDAGVLGMGIKSFNPLYQKEGGPLEHYQKAMPEKHQEWCAKWAEEALKCKNSEELITLAKSIYQLLEQDPNLDSMSPEDFDPTSGEGMEEGEAGDVSDGEALGYIDGDGEEGEDADGVFDPDLKDCVSSFDHDGKGGGKGQRGEDDGSAYTVASTEDDIVYKRGHKDPKGLPYVQNIVDSTEHTRYTEIRDSVSSTVKVMKAKLTRMLLSKQQRDWDFGRLNGKLDTKRLVSAYNRAENVYKKRIDREEANTAITILVDLSGSMSGIKAEVTTKASVALSECLENSGMPFKLVGFCNKKGISGVRRRSFSRVERLDTVIFKDFSDPLKICKGSVARLDEAVGGNNTDYDFILNELAILKKRPERRKVLFVLSDGSPAHGGASTRSKDIRLCREAVTKAGREGIECVGIGICDSSVKEIYPDYTVIQNAEDLGKAVFNKLARILVG